MYPSLFTYRKQLYIALALFPILVGALGFYTLLKSPYTGINFESKEGKWYVASVNPGSPAAAHPEMVGMEVVTIGDFKIWPYDFVSEYALIPNKESFNHFWEAQKYFDGHVKIGVPLNITYHTNHDPLQPHPHLNPLPDGEEPLFYPTLQGFIPGVVEGQGGDGINPTIQIIPSVFPLPHALSKVSPSFFSALATLFIGLVVMLKRPGEKKAILFFLFTLFGSLIIFGADTALPLRRDTAYNNIVFRVIGVVYIFAYIFGSAIFLNFCFLFPSEKRMISHNLLTALYALAAAIFLPSLFGGLFYSWKVTSIFSILCLIGGTAAMLHSYITIKSYHEKAQAKWVIYGTVLYMSLYLAYRIYSIFYGANDTVETLAGVGFLLIPLSMSFAILKYRLMDIDTLFDNTLIYTITLGLLVLLDMAVISGLIKAGVLDFSGPNPFIAISILVWTVILAYLPVRNFVQGRIKRILKREVYNANDVSLRLARELIAAADVPSAVEKTMDAVKKTLHPKDGEVVLLDDVRDALIFVGANLVFAQEGRSSRQGRLQESPLHDKCSEAIDITEPVHLFSILPSEELSKDWSGGAVVPLNGSTGRLGYIVLQDKKSERLYDRSDLDLLSTISSQLAMCIEAVRNKEESERKEKEAREEKDRIRREIHDGISSEFSGIIAYSERITGLLEGEGDPDIIKNMVKNIEVSSHRGVQELRNIISAIGSDAKTLDFAIAYIKRYSSDLLGAKGISLNVIDSTGNEETPIPPSLLVNLIRLSQEACHNIVKHADASIVSVTFRKDGDWLTLEIEDNGKGFDYDATIGNRGHGLRNMEKRVKELGGKIAFVSERGKGTMIKAGVPMM